MKVGVSAAPVGDLREGVGGQDVLAERKGLIDFSWRPRGGRLYFTNLGLRVNQTDSMLVDGNQQDLWKVWLCGLLNTKGTIKRVTSCATKS